MSSAVETSLDISDVRNSDRFLDYARNDKEKLGKPHVFARIHFEIQVERIGRVRFDDFLHELYENGVLPENRELVHRLEIDRDEKRPLQLGIRSEEHTSELQSLTNLVCRLLL